MSPLEILLSSTIAINDEYFTMIKIRLFQESDWPAKATYVAVDQGETILGTYYIKPNQHGLGDHICNCGYIVSENARGQGIASQICEHSQQEAVTQGFRAMQFNFVVSTNESAVHLWKKLGFNVIGTVPEAFRHPRHGYVDAFIMYKRLSE
jgi:RimJ/RimL family protein N-acetyltransferase